MQEEEHMHIELILVSFILQNSNNDLNELSIGLCSSDLGDLPGCCSYCKACLDVITEFSNVKIYREFDFPQNIPFSHWDFPTKLLNSTLKSFRFFQKIWKQYKDIIDSNKGNKVAYEILTKTLEELRSLDNIEIIDFQLKDIDKKIVFFMDEQKENCTQTEITQNIDLDSLTLIIMSKQLI